MDATIAAALISGGVGALGIVGTVVTSVVGSKDTRKATEQAIAASAANTRATLASAREDRLWERRAAVYEETLAAMAHRQYKLTTFLNGGKLEDASRDELENLFHSYGSPEWAAMQGRLIAYASDAVRDASGVAMQAGGLALDRYSEVLRIRDRLGSQAPMPVPDNKELAEAVQVLNGAFNTVGQANTVLMDTVRNELRSRPEAAMPPAAVPAVRRRLSRRG